MLIESKSPVDPLLDWAFKYGQESSVIPDLAGRHWIKSFFGSDIGI